MTFHLYFKDAPLAGGHVRRTKQTENTDGRVGLCVFFYSFNVQLKRPVMFYYTYRNEDGVYIHSWDPFSKKKKKLTLNSQKARANRRNGAFFFPLKSSIFVVFVCCFFYIKLAHFQGKLYIVSLQS